MNTSDDSIANYFNEQSQIISGLYERREFSLAQTAQNIFAKSLVLIAASVFETQLRDVVIDAISARTSGDSYIISFCKAKGIERQYHTWFDWKAKNANNFFNLFGIDAEARVKSLIDADKDIEKAINDFIFIGKSRNEIVHMNILTFPFSETAEAVFARVESARKFLEFAELVLSLPIRVDEASAVFPNNRGAS